MVAVINGKTANLVDSEWPIGAPLPPQPYEPCTLSTKYMTTTWMKALLPIITADHRQVHLLLRSG